MCLVEYIVFKYTINTTPMLGKPCLHLSQQTACLSHYIYRPLSLERGIILLHISKTSYS
jgi:hypothetical protein